MLWKMFTLLRPQHLRNVGDVYNILAGALRSAVKTRNSRRFNTEYYQQHRVFPI